MKEVSHRNAQRIITHPAVPLSSMENKTKH